MNTFSDQENDMYEEKIDILSDLFKVFGDSTRLRIMHTLMDKDLAVQEIADELEMTQSAISHQLKNLKNSHLVKSMRAGKQVIYSLDDDHVRTIIAMGIEHVTEHHGA